MKKKLTLKTEHLVELTTSELEQAAGGTYTSDPRCILSVTRPCHTGMCTQDVPCLTTIFQG
jgi:hypothetical protein